MHVKPVSFEAVAHAHARIRAHINRTPILHSHRLDQLLGHRVFFKAENLQKTGAFKARGGCNAVRSLLQQGAPVKTVVANSSGNHAQAVAWACAQMGRKCEIYMPAGASSVKAQATAACGATVHTLPDRDAVDRAVAEAADQTGVHWIPPFDHPQVIAGQGTAALEALLQIDTPDVVVAPCGGGGLLSGTVLATRTLAPQAAVIGAEPLNANDAAESLRRGEIVRLDKTPDTLADGARTPAVSALTLHHLQSLDDLLEISEQDMLFWTQWLSHLLKHTVEPTSALAMAGLVQWLRTQKHKKTALVILSGGNIDRDTHRAIWQQDWLSQTPSL